MNNDTSEQERAVKMAVTAAVQEDSILGGAIEELKEQYPYSSVGRFDGSLEEGILVPKKSARSAVIIISRTLIDKGILPAGSFKIKQTPYSDDMPFVLALTGEVPLVPVTVEIDDISKVNVTNVMHFLRDIENNPRKPLVTSANQYRWN